MIIKSMHGMQVNIVSTDKIDLIDSAGVRWHRDASKDNVSDKLIGYTCDNADTVLLTVEHMKRVCNGNNAINTPTTVPELREYPRRLPARMAEIVDGWPDQTLREILIEADEKHTNPGLLLERKVEAEIKKQEVPQESQEKAQESPQKPTPPRNTPRTRKQEGSITVTTGDVSVLLTPKQIEFMERLSECPEWSQIPVTGEYSASAYVEELSDTMSPPSVGAIITTLREKGILSTRKVKMGAAKGSVFKLTEMGVVVYKWLINYQR